MDIDNVKFKCNVPNSHISYITYWLPAFIYNVRNSIRHA